MTKKIIKVIWTDGSESSVLNFRSWDEINADKSIVERHSKYRAFNRQFNDLEDDILEYLYEDSVKNFAISKFDLIEEDEVDDFDINDYSDKEIRLEAIYRGMLIANTRASIIQDDLSSRFIKILEFVNPIEIEEIITNLEKKLNIY